MFPASAISTTTRQSVTTTHDYIQKLSQKDRKYVGPIGFYEDGTGQHAVEIEEALHGTWWFHVLIYDKGDKRIKTIKYSCQVHLC